MGAWGAGIFDNDFALDLRDEYKDFYSPISSPRAVMRMLIDGHMPQDETDEEYSVFWIALALLQWQHGELLPDVRDKAIEQIDKGADLELWGESSSKNYKERKRVLVNARKKLLSPMKKHKNFVDNPDEEAAEKTDHQKISILFREEYAKDLKDAYRGAYSSSYPDTLAELLAESYLYKDRYRDKEALFWVVIALLAWQHGELLPDIKAKAKEMLDSGVDLNKYKIGSAQYIARAEAFEVARRLLDSEMPKAKRKKHLQHNDPWEVGDLISYRLSDQYSMPPQYAKKYILLRVIDVDYVRRSKVNEATYAVYKWCGERMATPDVADTFDFLSLQENSYQKYYTSCKASMTYLTKKERAAQEMTAIGKDPDFKKEDYPFFIGGETNNLLSAADLEVLIYRRFLKEGIEVYDN